MRDVYDEYVDRTARPELRPPDSRLIAVVQFGFPMIGHMGTPYRPSPEEIQAGGENKTAGPAPDSDQR
jgi:hypothetical protein